MNSKAKDQITRQRLSNQYLIGDPLTDPAQVVEWFGAVQAQDYAGSLLGIGLRLGNSGVKTVEKAIAAGTILRTWSMRGTVHFVPAADAKWMLRTLTPRVIARSAARYRELGLDADTLTRCRDLLIKTLQGGKLLPRKQIYAALEAGGISNTKERGSHIIGHWSQEALICVAPHQGKQPTVALLDDFVPHSCDLQDEAAWAELALRYFRSHGPATIQDFCWWTGLTIREAKIALESNKATLQSEVIDGNIYWQSTTPISAKNHSPCAFLLPPYDEYLVAYRDRSAALDPAHAEQTGNGIFSPILVIDGQVVGKWKRTIHKGTLIVAATLLRQLDSVEAESLDSAVNRYGAFMGMPTTMKVVKD